MTTLADLPFVDIYIRLDGPAHPLFRPNTRGETALNKLVPDTFLPAIEDLTEAVRSTLQRNEGAVTFESVRCRFSRQLMSDGSIWACGRRINDIIPSLDTLGFPSHIRNHLQGLGKRDGLILVAGSAGAGKTTTAASLLGHYLNTYGGAAVTIEDPVEYIFPARHGETGQCFQVEVQNDDEWAIALKRSLRWAPRYIFVGEIRTPQAAEQLLRAASTGYTVLTTVHAGSLEEALMGLLFLAERAMGPGCESILAAGLTALLFQTMRDTGPFVRYVFTEPDNPGDPVRSLIREKKIGMMSTYIDRIAARLANAPMPLPPRTQEKL